MTTNVSASGATMRIVASESFPSGFSVYKYSDESDPFDIPDQEITGTGKDINGNLVYWSVQSATELTIAVLANTEEDRNLSVIYENNRAGKGRVPVDDEITIVVIFPDGETRTYLGGKMTSGPPGTGASSDGRKKSKTYSFAFESVS